MVSRYSPGQTAEHERLAAATDDHAPWRLWGPYVSGRQWGTVREDYSADGNAWDFFPFDHSHRRAYRWGEDGIAGICDRYGFLNLAPAFWNGDDDRLKERLFGLTNAQGNHGEDTKELWWHVDATPTHSYGEYLYRYPQRAFPYRQLVDEGSAQPKEAREYKLVDTGVLDEDRFFDITVVHAKDSPDDIVVEFHVVNHGPEAAPIDVLGQWWFRNTWSWGRDERRPVITRGRAAGRDCLTAKHEWLGTYHLVAEDGPAGAPRFLLCDNETNAERVFGSDSGTPQPAHPKDAIDDAVVHGDESGLADDKGTKAAVWWHLDAVQPGEEVVLRLRMMGDASASRIRNPFAAACEVVADRKADADAFYGVVIPEKASAEDTFIARRAFAGLLWCKQLYRYSVRDWLEGDPNEPAPPAERLEPEPDGRNTYWRHLALADIISMPDEWEYPWFASWDLAFHCVALARIDPWFAKEQLVLMCREWCMHPSGQLAAYEWKFSDVNPPVLAWAARVVFFADGAWDRAFLVRVFTKLLLNFGWWVNRKDENGSGLFEGGFLGLDNVTVFDRSAPLPEGQILEQSDATSWMAFYCLSMLKIAVELARDDDGWGDIATKFFEHFLEIAEAMDAFGNPAAALWDEEDGFYYDVLVDNGVPAPVRVRSLVGLLPLLGVMNLPDDISDQLPDLKRHTAWLRDRRPEVTEPIMQRHDGVTTLSVVTRDRLRRLIQRILDEGEFLSPHGIRSLSAAYRSEITVELPGHGKLPIDYQPAESRDYLFGGNSNWRGPVWFPINTLLVHALATYGRGIAKDETFEFPTGSGKWLTLEAITHELRQRLISLFRVGPDGRRPSDPIHMPTGPLWQAHPTFSEYFNGDTGAGLGAAHQTGWTAMVADLICAEDGDDPVRGDAMS
ncbi:MGH1-like glycoside hydrolase domain-containing protein [Tessaracoccus flavus]|uniref:Glucosidase n=1 Tax=Tessaracoccus flavus TaxID=1610493 RepID=A0A1Q2CGL1_9ACTN|nr:glucosidase [Tessaracoccus flavus]AQP45258.1 glucosidase [Tessaracoccus flavus]SDY51042.1 Glycosyl hydrolase family 63 C-terminal domain-containing protein [Tessaracoccus flavus]